MPNDKSSVDPSVGPLKMTGRDIPQRIVAQYWSREDTPQLINVGVNKQTWQVGDDWLACDYPRASLTVERTAQLFSSMPDSPVALPALIPARDGATYINSHERIWWMTSNLEGRTPDPTVRSHTLAVAAGLARVHAYLASVPIELAVSNKTSTSRFNDAQTLASDPRLRFTADEQAYLCDTAATVSELLASKAREPQIIHGDPSAPNVKLDRAGSVMTGLMDWDNCCTDDVVADIATVAQTVVLRSGTDTPLDDIAAVNHAYATVGGLELSVSEVLAALVKAKFSSISHHGRRYLRGEAEHQLVHSQIEKMKTVHALLNSTLRVRE